MNLTMTITDAHVWTGLALAAAWLGFVAWLRWTAWRDRADALARKLEGLAAESGKVLSILGATDAAEATRERIMDERVQKRASVERGRRGEA